MDINISLILKGIFKICFRLKASGTENLPEQGPYIICANHTTYLDGLFIALTMPFAVVVQTFFLGDSQFLDHPVLRPYNYTAECPGRGLCTVRVAQTTVGVINL